MVRATRIAAPKDIIVTWGGFKWMPDPEEGFWFKWEPKPQGIYERVHEDDIPDDFWVTLAKRALLK